jgi:hypothetical protein
MKMLSAPKSLEIEAISLLESPRRFMEIFTFAATTIVYNTNHHHINQVHATLEALGRECRKFLGLE